MKYSNVVPMFYESLQFSWFFFDIIIKSFLLTDPKDGKLLFTIANPSRWL